MNIIVAPDSFKGCLTSLQAADAIVQGVRDVLPNAETVVIPLADGGPDLSGLSHFDSVPE